MRHNPKSLNLPLFTGLLAFGCSALSADLQIDISNAKQSNGLVYFALYDSAESYEEREMREGAISTESDTPPSAVFTGLPPGDYAITVYQDVNANRKLDTNLIGIPNEPYGFSQNAMGAMGPPDFTAAAISLSADDETQVINIELRN
ncbi:DUF2141 domain-containing protein [Halopseudomonas pelagia]|uniref:DUF2141 domain-containing protein n=1 Tax=Halopseudomonas pelagia TaxID=553151 RepID=A0AA91U0D1_9GAMM|nr:DUF2141 domain-containing protein [Halopseudomonas pelagia]PCC98290.1 hypothetical protein CO192_16000 [Halopseudomonas pelagia]QFY56695.1 DUF2141 domain-containing protein [Halopseudomonas pelagia]